MRYIQQLSVILTISLIAELLEIIIPIPVAASIYGLLLMLFCLITKLIPLEKVEGAADFLVENMAIFFIPPTVGIMTSIEELQEMLIPLCVISVVSTILVMAVTGRVSQAILQKGKNEMKENVLEQTSESTLTAVSHKKDCANYERGVESCKKHC